MKLMRETVGISLAVYNCCEILRHCLNAIYKSCGVQLFIVVIDDGSSDGTHDMIKKEFPKVEILKGNGNFWWTRATNVGIQKCLDSGCDYIVLMNPDVIVEPDAISHMVQESKARNDAIVSPVVLNYDDPSVIWEAGHKWEPVVSWLPIFWASKYLYKHGTALEKIPSEPYKTVSVVGRGGVISRRALDILGVFDEITFPQYGADADMSLRAYKAKFPMYIVPRARVRLHVEQTGCKIPEGFISALRQYWHYLVTRKNGEALFVLYSLNFKNLPLYIAIPNYIFMLALNSYRYWQKYFQRKVSKQKLKSLVRSLF